MTTYYTHLYNNLHRFFFLFLADTDPTHSTGGTDQVDLLTCGQCQRVFLLSDICRFVQHKMTGCSKDSLAANCNSNSGDDCAGPPPPPQPLDNGLSASKSKSHHRSQSPAGADDPSTLHHNHHNHHRRPPPSSTPKRTSDRNNGGEDGAASSEDEKSTAAATKGGRVKQGSESSEDLGYKKSNRSALSCVDAESNTTNSGMLCLFYIKLLCITKRGRLLYTNSLYYYIFSYLGG